MWPALESCLSNEIKGCREEKLDRAEVFGSQPNTKMNAAHAKSAVLLPLGRFALIPERLIDTL